MRLLQKQLAQISAQVLRIVYTYGGTHDLGHFPGIITSSPGKHRNNLYQTLNNFYSKLCSEIEAMYADGRRRVSRRCVATRRGNVLDWVGCVIL